MNKALIVLLLMILANPITAQEWSEPVLISTMLGYNDDPDFCVDSSGTIHCVWSHEIATNYRKIYYSKSEDAGETWTEPEDVSLNDSLWMSKPHVATNTENNLYLCYDYNTGGPGYKYILLKKYNGSNWSEPDTVTSEMPGAYYNRLIIDNNDKIYIFWTRSYKIYYRYYENDTWSDIICPYDDDNKYFIVKAIADNSNNLHCIGVYDEWENYEAKKTYFKYEYNSDKWSGLSFLTNDKSLSGEDIALDSNQNPHFAYNILTNFELPYNDATAYSYYDGINWIPKEIIVEDPQYQTIAVDNYNRPHIVDREKLEKNYSLKAIPSKIVHYMKYKENWEGIIIDSSEHEIANLKLLYKNHRLYIIYVKVYEVDEKLPVDIFFSKYNIPSIIPENTIKYFYNNQLDQNYPNPFKRNTTIHFYLNKGGYTTLKILDLQGRLITTLIDGQKAKGEYTINWDGRENNGQEVKPGLYLYRLQVDKRCMSRSLQLIK